ncbi:hypothetical protein G5714_002785 [Onychostoma macrolepis]|uniref:Uncharacterized protein n=1 Tax=Onychostoma macrolepis TaxID=369639 RepID=A0A7J6D7N7_9TELE|nr:hypothetical protein G5714_002785 [Onychostoma macrolepis]
MEDQGGDRGSKAIGTDATCGAEGMEDPGGNKRLEAKVKLKSQKFMARLEESTDRDGARRIRRSQRSIMCAHSSSISQLTRSSRTGTDSGMKSGAESVMFRSFSTFPTVKEIRPFTCARGSALDVEGMEKESLLCMTPMEPLVAVHFHPMHMPAAKPTLPSKVDQFQSYMMEPAHSLSQGSECDLHADRIYQAGLQDEVSTTPGIVCCYRSLSIFRDSSCGQGHGKNGHLIERELA